MPRQKFSLIKDVEIATYYDLIGQVVKIYPSNGKTDLYITDYSPNQLLYFYEWGQGEEGFEARDGDEFGYVSRSSKNAKKWPGPFGKLTLAVTLWSPHSAYAQGQVKEGDFCLSAERSHTARTRHQDGLEVFIPIGDTTIVLTSAC